MLQFRFQKFPLKSGFQVSVSVLVSTSYRHLSALVKDTAIGTGCHGFHPQTDQNGAQFRLRLSTATMFLRSCVAQALSRGDGPCLSLRASAEYREYNQDLI